jgi:hypothetical protein
MLSTLVSKRVFDGSAARDLSASKEVIAGLDVENKSNPVCGAVVVGLSRVNSSLLAKSPAGLLAGGRISVSESSACVVVAFRGKTLTDGRTSPSIKGCANELSGGAVAGEAVTTLSTSLLCASE